jgi:hypothetical protein
VYISHEQLHNMSKLQLITIVCLTLLSVRCSADSMNDQTMNEPKKEDCCVKENSTSSSETSEITCPECGHKKTEVLPTDVCTIKYTCVECNAELTPKDGDCCVYCTYGTHKCPSMQGE